MPYEKSYTDNGHELIDYSRSKQSADNRYGKLGERDVGSPMLDAMRQVDARPEDLFERSFEVRSTRETSEFHRGEHDHQRRLRAKRTIVRTANAKFDDLTISMSA